MKFLIRNFYNNISKNNDEKDIKPSYGFYVFDLGASGITHDEISFRLVAAGKNDIKIMNFLYNTDTSELEKVSKREKTLYDVLRHQCNSYFYFKDYLVNVESEEELKLYIEVEFPEIEYIFIDELAKKIISERNII